ncbi:hypothetical protein Fmac_007984 [Flemingia macrophylla]|uniref:Uncharacterized protein n=1 Tax=Flemingia macrophylla TaxID=520843 RepID=A0ABD1MW67_9FABA
MADEVVQSPNELEKTLEELVIEDGYMNMQFVNEIHASIESKEPSTVEHHMRLAHLCSQSQNLRPAWMCAQRHMTTTSCCVPELREREEVSQPPKIIFNGGASYTTTNCNFLTFRGSSFSFEVIKVGLTSEVNSIAKSGAKLVMVVSCAKVPKVTIIVG